MSEKKLYSYTALFDTPDKIIHAAKSVAEKGYTKFDVNTPYPVHGMDDAMKLKRSKIGWVTLVFGLLGTTLAVAMMGWMMGVDYRIVIGGKPFFAVPAWGPIIFELSVLLGALATVGAMLFIFFKFPNNSHPMHDTEYMKNVSSDKYGISIEAVDPKFNQDEIAAMFNGLGAETTAPIYFDEEEVNFKPTILDRKFLVFLGFVAIATSLGVYATMNIGLHLPPFNWMVDQDKSSPQQTSEIFANNASMLQPVKGTVARGFIPYKFSNQPELASKLLVNPLIPSEENLKIGKRKFDIYCSPCHGYLAEGDSRMRDKFPNPPSLHSEKARNWT
ncbi:MAG: DUF3341 domain-containing protein, partial [Ignavibacteriae bacterium]|nr:DUF3341 domain-containing protein [Ignavibacteriota bacterium]